MGNASAENTQAIWKQKRSHFAGMCVSSRILYPNERHIDLQVQIHQWAPMLEAPLDLLSTVTAIEALPSYTAELSQKLSQICYTKTSCLTSSVTSCPRRDIEQAIENKGDSHDLTRVDAPGQNRKLAGATGLEPATSAVTGQRSEPVELRPRARKPTRGGR